MPGWEPRQSGCSKHWRYTTWHKDGVFLSYRTARAMHAVQAGWHLYWDDGRFPPVCIDYMAGRLAEARIRADKYITLNIQGKSAGAKPVP